MSGALTALYEAKVFLNLWWETMAVNGFIPQFPRWAALRQGQD